MRLAIFLLFLALTPMIASAAYELVWADEFSQPDGSSPDPNNWNYNLGGGGWGNGELQYYTNRTENARIENGQLVVELRKEPNYNGTGYNYTSARLLTQGKQSWTYGKIEARIRLPFGDASGLWPAFWMLGSNISSVGWPQCGEIDIMEYISREPNEVFGTIHGPGYAGGASFGNIVTFPGPVAPPEPPLLADPYDDAYYHVYSVEWEPNRIRWYLDGVLYHTAVPADVAPNSWVFFRDQFIILNLAIGGNFGGTVDDANLTFPTQMLVDYVRVYQNDTLEPPAIEIPGLIQAEDYTSQEGVQTENTSDLGGGLNVGFMGNGDWMEYELNVPIAGLYTVLLRTANGSTQEGSLTLSAGGSSLTSPPVPNNGGWQVWTTVDAGEIELPAGRSTLRVDVTTPGGDAMNLNWMDIRLALSSEPRLALERRGFFNDENEDGFADPGETISYTFTVANSGSVPITGVSVTDSLVSVERDPSSNQTIDVGAIDGSTFTATYAITESDINVGQVIGTATASSNETASVNDEEQTPLPVDLLLDGDNDQFINLMERAFGLDLFQPDSPSMGPVGSLTEIDGENHLHLTYRRRTGGSGTTGVDYSANGFTYTVEISDDLQSWNSGPTAVISAGSPVANGDGTETVTVRTVSPNNSSGGFIRLKVTYSE